MKYTLIETGRLHNGQPVRRAVWARPKYLPRPTIVRNIKIISNVQMQHERWYKEVFLPHQEKLYSNGVKT